MTRLSLHPLCALFPRIPEAEYKALREDIRRNGLRQPVVMFDGMILDGANRYSACLEEGIKPEIVQFEGDDPASFVLSLNLRRRHLAPGQYATIIASITDWKKAQLQGANRHTMKRCNAAPLQTESPRAAE